MKFPAYPKYKASGIDWLGAVPEHWEVKRLKTAATYKVSNVDKVPSDDELPVKLCNYTDVYYNDHIRSTMGLMETTATYEEIHRFKLEKDDVVITKDSESWDDIAIPALVVETSPDLVCGYHLAIVRTDAKNLVGPYLFRLFQSCAINQQFQLAATGVTRYGLPKAAIGESLILLPTIDEQQAIANFLYAQTAKIDTLIAKKREIIEKLKEKRTALISRTVTRGLPPEAAKAAGLNPNPKLKPSDIDWLGDVPEHWDVLRLKYTASINDETLPETTNPDFEFNYVDIGSVQSTEGIVEQTEMTFDKAPSRARRIVRNGDTIVSTVRTYLRAIAPIKDIYKPIVVSTGFAVVRPINIDAEYLSYALRESRFVEEIVSRSVGVSYPAVNVDDISTIYIAVPDKVEQITIAAYLNQETQRITQMTVKVEEAISKLLEYRSALITAAVTGKIDVREVNV